MWLGIISGHGSQITELPLRACSVRDGLRRIRGGLNPLLYKFK
jgi:hypothetical protein